jgi:propionyl-CoA synthetase
VQRDTGGYAVALASSMEHIYCGKPGETMFTTSDVGWVVGHSYICYAPLLAGCTSVLFEGKPVGTVWLAVSQRDSHGDEAAPATRALLLQLSGDRAAVRHQTVTRALEALLGSLT